MDINLQLKEFECDNVDQLIQKKSKDKQQKLFAVTKPRMVTFSADECQKMCEDIGVTYSAGYEHRILQYIVTTEAKDRYGDVVKASGADLKNYMKNPVMFFNHDYEAPIIGNSLSVWENSAKRRVEAYGLFMPNEIDTTGLSDLVFRMANSGFLKACSVGFMPLKATFPQSPEEADRLGIDRYGAQYDEWEMLEWSPCGVPANPEALQNCLKSITKKTFNSNDIAVLSRFNLFTDENLKDFFVERAIKNNKSYNYDLFLTESFCKEGNFVESKKVIPFKSYPLDPEDAAWDGPAEIKDASFEDLKIMCAWYDESNEEAKASYKLPHHSVGNKHTVWKGVAAAMAALLGAREGVDIPESDKQGVYNHLAKHYKEFEKEVPEMKIFKEDESTSISNSTSNNSVIIDTNSPLLIANTLVPMSPEEYVSVPRSMYDKLMAKSFEKDTLIDDLKSELVEMKKQVETLVQKTISKDIGSNVQVKASIYDNISLFNKPNLKS